MMSWGSESVIVARILFPQRGHQIRDQVLDCLDSDLQPEQVIGHRGTRPLDRSPMLDQTLNATK